MMAGLVTGDEGILGYLGPMRLGQKYKGKEFDEHDL